MPKRRANGEGNIRKRKDGRWEGRYTAGYDPESRKRIIKNVLGKTQAEVKEKLKTAISESQRLDVSKAGNYTVASWVRTWYEVYAEPRMRPSTKAYYTNYIENHIIPGIGNISLDKLTTIQIQRFYNNLQKTGRVQRKNFPELRDKSLSPRVVRGVHTLLHNCLEQAVAERLILTNPAQGGDTRVLDDYSLFAKPAASYELLAEQDGYIIQNDAEKIGSASVLLGAGRQKKGDPLDFAAGIVLHKKRGATVHKGESLATFYGAPDKFAAAAEEYRSGLVYGDTQPEEAPLVYALVTKDGVERYE